MWINRIGTVKSKSGIVSIKGTKTINPEIIDEINYQLRKKCELQRANDAIALEMSDSMIACK